MGQNWDISNQKWDKIVTYQSKIGTKLGHIKSKMGQNRDISDQNGTKLLHIKVKWDKIGTYQIKMGQNQKLLAT